MGDGCVQYKIPFIRPSFPSIEEMSEDYQNIVTSNWYSNFGQYEKELSARAARYVGDTVYATTVANCTLGIDIAVLALFDTSKKKVLTQSFTFAAGAEVLIRNGYEPILVDIEKQTWQMNIQKTEELITKKREDIAGILLCNTFGVGNPDIEKWEQLAKQYGLPLILDTAAGFGSRYTAGEIVGGRGDCEVFSLHATKPFAVGEGGLITSRNEQLIHKLRSLQNFGFENDRTVHSIGMNAKMQEFSCAIGIRQIDKLAERIHIRQDKLRIYKEQLEPQGFVFQPGDDMSTVPFVSVLTPDTIDASRAQERLIGSGIEARRYYTPAVHLHSAIMAHASISENLTVTEDISRSIISLPLLNDMTDEDITLICDTLKEI